MRFVKAGTSSVVALCVGMILSALTGHAQNTNATLSGSVTDPSGAAIPGAKITLTNKSSGAQVTGTSTESGDFNFQNLPPGKYDLSATAASFQSQTQKDIQLDTAQQGRANVQLTPGSADQTVEVTAEIPNINYTDATLSGTVAPETLQSFPLIVSGAPRTSVAVATMMPGVTTGGGGNAFNTRINGGIVSGDEALVDGATAMEGYMNQSGMVSLQTDFGMSPDITSEVTVLTANYDAQYGNSTSGQLIIQTRSGGEKFHGAVFEYFRNDYLNSFKWGSPVGSHKPEDKQNDYGGNLGGPLFIPKLLGPAKYVKGYFYFNFEGFKEVGGANPSTLSIPSLNARSGNFSNAGSQLYYPNDPAKYGADAGAPIVFNGVVNQINPAYEDPVAKGWLAALPTPTNGDELNNYFIPRAGQGSLTNSENVYFGRLDFNVGAKDHGYYTSWWQFTGVNAQTDLPIAVSTASPADPENANIQRVNWEHTFSATATNHATIGYLNRNEGYYALNGGAALPKVSGTPNPNYLPQFNFGGGYSQLGSNNPPTSAGTLTTRGTWAFNDVFTKVQGSHTLKAGFEWRKGGTSIHEGSNEGGTFTFEPDTTGNQGCAAEAPCPGNAAASFYLGATASATATYYNVHAEYPRQYAYAVHAGDSWRVNPKLTLNYSLRWDYITPFREKFNNLSFFDPDGLNPGAVTAAGTQLKGRLAFAGSKFGSASYGADYPEEAFKKALSPRVGIAYSFDQKTVVRAGYGIYFGQAFYPGWSGGLSQDGFNKNLTLNESPSGNFQAPSVYLASGISPSQVGPTQDISSDFDNGQTPSLYRPRDGNHRPYSSQWNLTIERQLPQSFVGSLSYVGTKGTHLPSTLDPINVLNPFNTAISSIGTDLATSYTAADGPAVFAAHGVGVPYVGWAQQMTGCSPTLAQALQPYPQYCGNIQGLNEFHALSIYHSLQGRLERRFTNGLYALVSFTYAKLFTDASDTVQATSTNGTGNQGNNGAFSPYDPYNRRWGVAPDNVPVTLQVSVVYNLPFGRQQRYLSSGAFSSLLGGWQVSPLFRYEYGTPLSFYSSSCPTASLVPQFRQSCVPEVLYQNHPNLVGRNDFNPYSGAGKLFNINAFQTDFSAFGNTGNGSAVSKLYGPSFKNWDIAFSKNTKITERVNFKLNANFFNAFNNHYFINQGGNYGGPATAFVTDVAATGNTFGTWNGTVSAPRTIQFAGRIEF